MTRAAVRNTSLLRHAGARHCAVDRIGGPPAAVEREAALATAASAVGPLGVVSVWCGSVISLDSEQRA